MDQSQSGIEAKEAAINTRMSHRSSTQVLREFRKARLENQTRFWARFGVTQSRGSRFETGEEIPPPISILLNLYLKGVVTDQDLGQALSGGDSVIQSYISPEVALVKNR